MSAPDLCVTCGQVHKRGCRGHKKDGSPCGSNAIKGATVCRSHGGAARHVREAAERRLAAMQVPALRVVARCLDPRTFKAEPAIALKAAHDILVGAGLPYGTQGAKQPQAPTFTPPPGTETTITTTIRTAALTDDEWALTRIALEKMGVNPDRVIDVPPAKAETAP